MGEVVVEINYVGVFQVVLFVYFKVGGVVCGCDFQCFDVEFYFYCFVGDDGYLVVGQWNVCFLVYQMLEVFVFGMYSNCLVGEDGFGVYGGDVDFVSFVVVFVFGGVFQFV